MNQNFEYRINRIPDGIDLTCDTSAPEWSAAGKINIASVRPESSDHIPATSVRLVYNEQGLHALFEVSDMYVKARCTEYMDMVCRDSCVEFFVKPIGRDGYFNFEFSCTGVMHASYVTDEARLPDGGLKSSHALSSCSAASIKIISSLSGPIEEELCGERVWSLAFMIPFSVLSPDADCIVPEAGNVWSGNFYKCADDTSHPHWMSWAPVDELNFHLPRCFGKLIFN